jgi:hypothetical protein
MSAKFIIDNEKDYICNICTDIIDKDKIIGLKCDFDKHIFCYYCIFDWYNSVKKSHNFGNYPIKTVCPICRKNGGLLPVMENMCPINGVNIKYSQNMCINIKICGALLKNNKSTCKLAGKDFYGGFCGKHQNLAIIKSTLDSDLSNLKQDSSNLKQDSSKPKLSYCGYKLKTKDGVCSKLSNMKYGGLCLTHFKVKNNESVNETVNELTIVV